MLRLSLSFSIFHPSYLRIVFRTRGNKWRVHGARDDRCNDQRRALITKMLLVYIILGCRHELYSTVSASSLSLSLFLSPSLLSAKRKKCEHGIAPCGKLLRNPRGFIRSRFERKKFIQIQLRSDFG